MSLSLSPLCLFPILSSLSNSIFELEVKSKNKNLEFESWVMHMYTLSKNTNKKTWCDYTLHTVSYTHAS